MYENTEPERYLILGFEGVGKYSYIRELLRRKHLASCILAFDGGLEEYSYENVSSEDIVTLFFYEKSIYRKLIDYIEQKPDIRDHILSHCDEIQIEMLDIMIPNNIIVEYNGTWKVDDLWKRLMLDNKEYSMMATVVDATKFEAYFKDMYSSLTDKFSESQLIVFTNCGESTNMEMYAEMVHDINPNAHVIFKDAEDKNLPCMKYDINKLKIDENPYFSIFCD